MKKQIWIVKGLDGAYSDEELINLIKKGNITGSNKIICKDLKDWITINDSIYQFYLKKENEDEVI